MGPNGAPRGGEHQPARLPDRPSAGFIDLAAEYISRRSIDPAELEKWLAVNAVIREDAGRGSAAVPERGVDVSIVVPAFNEEKRLPPTLIDMLEFFQGRGRSFEILVVDDGSCDRTAAVVERFQQVRPEVRLVRVAENRGKGHAVRLGVSLARGDNILFADADGATPIGEFERLEAALREGAQLAIGSRARASRETEVVTGWYRKLLGRAFAFCVNRLLVDGIADTQCGFKLFRAPAAKFLFERQKSDRFSFDCEILFVAQRCKMRISEVPVNWVNIAGSKVHPWRDGLCMLRDLVVFRLRHGRVTAREYEEWLAEGYPQADYP